MGEGTDFPVPAIVVRGLGQASRLQVLGPSEHGNRLSPLMECSKKPALGTIWENHREPKMDVGESDILKTDQEYDLGVQFETWTATYDKDV